jgi:hypothetical protein
MQKFDTIVRFYKNRFNFTGNTQDLGRIIPQGSSQAGQAEAQAETETEQ